MTGDIKLSNLRVALLVSRLESLTEAARALHMTQGAVSKNVQQLEQRLGAPLFRRTRDGVVPIDHSRSFFGAVGEAVRIIDGAVADFSEGDARGDLRVVAPPIIAQRFIIPNLNHLEALHPELQIVFRVRMSSTARAPDMDVEIFFRGEGDRPPGARWLAGDRFWLVAHPALAEGDIPVARVPDFPLLQHVKVTRAWPELARQLGWDLGRARLHEYGQYALILDALTQNQGIALVPRLLVAEAVNEGRLRRIGPEFHFPNVGYYFQAIRGDKAAQARKFHAWLSGIMQRGEGA